MFDSLVKNFRVTGAMQLGRCLVSVYVCVCVCIHVFIGVQVCRCVFEVQQLSVHNVATLGISSC